MLRRLLPHWKKLLTGLGLLLLLPGVVGVGLGLRPVARGVNDAGAEFDPPAAGAPLRLSGPATLDRIARSGLKLVRLPFRWEQVQPEPGGGLNPAAVDSLRGYLREAHRRGLGVVLDAHNFARYSYLDRLGAPQLGVVGEDPVTIDRFADFWFKLSGELHSEPGLYAFGLMNEPHDILTRRWEAASQAALLAIRRSGARTLVMVPGSNWSSCHVWVMCHEHRAWIRDPADNFAYEAHTYFDRDATGRYLLSFEEERTREPDLTGRALGRLEVFVEWCQENGVRGFLGEFGCPDDPGWCGVLDAFLTRLDQVHMDGAVWATGERWPPDYPMLLGENQWKVLSAHPGGRTSDPWSDFCLGYTLLARRARGWVHGLKAEQK